MNESGPIKRRLTAILAADAVGYSARMAENEERTLKTLAGHRRLIDSLIADHGGRIVGTAGDSVLAEFGSSVDAVRCAVEIQEALATRNEALPEAERMQFRIGINLGDVIVDGGDILGDGVNVASRLEGIAEPGGICIASSVFDQISGKLNLGFEDIGERTLKNIGRPVHAYRFSRTGVGGVRPGPRKASSRGMLVAALGGAAAFAAGALAVFYLTRPPQREAAPPAAATPPRVEPAAQAAAQPAPNPAASTPPPPTPTPSTAPPTPQTRAAVPAETPEQPSSSRRTSLADAAPPVLRDPVPSPSRANQAQATARTYTTGMVQARCQRPDGSPGPFIRGRAQVVDGEVVIAVGEPGEPGHVNLRGKPDASGMLVLDGFIIPAAGPSRGTQVSAHYEGRLTNGRGMLAGRQGLQRCSLALQLK